jgi:hypothetical protein
MALSFLYLALRALLGALVHSRRGLHVKGIELLVLRHELEILRRQVARPESTQGDRPVRVTERAQHAVLNAKQEAGWLGHDRVGTEHLLLGLAREGEGVAVRVLQELGAGLLELREAVAAQYAAGVDPEPFPPDRRAAALAAAAVGGASSCGPAGAAASAAVGDQLVLISLLTGDCPDTQVANCSATCWIVPCVLECVGHQSKRG